jgi:phosphoribosyl 1,2-cyclic phosphodiesterase
MREFIFLGTGTSGSVPNVSCITKQPKANCKVCVLASTLEPEGDQWNKNRRFNTSGIYRYTHSDGRVRNVLVDCGKTFYPSSLHWFPRFDISSIDAVILTHGHADAMMGLDDLRQWTWTGAGNQPKTIPIYLNQETMDVVSSVFPYIVDSSKATGGGQVSSVEFYVFDSKSCTDFCIEELHVIPFEGGF